MCEQLDYNLPCRCFVGLSIEEPSWDHSTFTKNRDRLIESWAAVKSMRRRDGEENRPGPGRNPTLNWHGEWRTVAADKAYDTAQFVADCRERGVTPQVAMNISGTRSSAIDSRATRHPGYVASQRIQRRIEECFGWSKDGRPLHKMKVYGKRKVDYLTPLTVGIYALLKVNKLLDPPRCVRRSRSASGARTSRPDHPESRPHRLYRADRTRWNSEAVMSEGIMIALTAQSSTAC